MIWPILYTRQAQKDARKLALAGLKDKALKLLDIVHHNPYQNPLPYEKLVGDLAGAYSRRITLQHRLIYQVQDSVITVFVIAVGKREKSAAYHDANKRL